jgi:hypothetical protein
MRGTSSPSPRLLSGRLRPSEPVIGPAEGGTRWTGYGEGRGEGALPQAQTRGDAPSPGMSAKDALIPTSPRKRGEVKSGPRAAHHTGLMSTWRFLPSDSLITPSGLRPFSVSTIFSSATVTSLTLSPPALTWRRASLFEATRPAL